MVASNTLAGSIARKGLLRDYLAIIIGAFIMAVGLAVFLVDAKVVPGGVSGLSMAVHYLSGSRVPVGLTMWLFNIPLYLWGIRELGKQFGVRTLVGFTTNAFFIDLLRGDVPGLGSIRLHEHPAIVNLRHTDFLFLILVGSVLLGVGLGIIFKFRGTTAGSDVIAAVGQKRWGLKPGVVFMAVDSLVIVFAGIVIHLRHLDTERPALTLSLYAFFLLFISSRLVDVIIDGFDYARSAIIISSKPEEIGQPRGRGHGARRHRRRGHGRLHRPAAQGALHRGQPQGGRHPGPDGQGDRPPGLRHRQQRPRGARRGLPQPDLTTTRRGGAALRPGLRAHPASRVPARGGVGPADLLGAGAASVAGRPTDAYTGAVT